VPTTEDSPDHVAALLNAGVGGAVLTHRDGEYDAALTGFNLAVRHEPDVVVIPTSADDVASAVRVAREAGWKVNALGAGHGVLTAQRGGVAIATRELAGVEIDVDERTARVGAGTRWQDVLEAAAPFGLAPLAGSSPLVGVVGYVLGGGLGPVARTFGYAADHVQTIELVDGAGRLRRVDAQSDPELFWALRGGKNGLGIVTALTIDLMPVPRLHAGGLYFAAADLTRVLHAWLDWGRAIPESVSTSVSILRLPPLPDLPEPLRGQLVLHVRFAHVGDTTDGDRLLAPIRATATPIVDTVRDMPYSELGQIHDDPAQAMPYTEGGALLDHLDHEGLDELIDRVGPAADVPLIAVELRQLGGALAREPRVPNAVPGRAAGYTLHLIGAPVPELLDTVLPGLIQSTIASMGPWLAEEALPNFFGRANPPGELEKCWAPAQAERLRAVRSDIDPDGVFDIAVHD
jgi:hypothetical protein